MSTTAGDNTPVLRQRPVAADSMSESDALGEPAASPAVAGDVDRKAVVEPAYTEPAIMESYHRALIVFLGMTVFLGTLMSLLTSSAYETSFRGRLPAANKLSFASTSLPGIFSGIPIPLPNYFANKRNIVNVIFVKKAWAWTTLLFLGHWLSGLLAKSTGEEGVRRKVNENRYEVIYRPIKRYAIATVFWVLVTSWFFGPPLADRLLIASGAVCVPSHMSSSSSLADAQGAQSINDPNHVIDHAECFSKASRPVTSHQLGKPVELTADPETGKYSIEGDLDLEKGAASASSPSHAHGHGHKLSNKVYWKGGHDISGHSFLLTMSSLFLLTEIAPTLAAIAQAAQSGAAPSAAGSGVAVPAVSRGIVKLENRIQARKYWAYATVGLISMWWWMLLMTSLYFHTPQEKISGFLTGVAGWWISYLIAG